MKVPAWLHKRVFQFGQHMVRWCLRLCVFALGAREVGVLWDWISMVGDSADAHDRMINSMLGIESAKSRLPWWWKE